MNLQEKKDFEEWKEEVKKDFMKHGRMSQETHDAMDKLDSNLIRMEKELRKLSDNSIRVEETLKQVVKTLEKIDDKYATKDELELLETKLAPTKKVVTYILVGVGGILIAVLTTAIKLVIF